MRAIAMYADGAADAPSNLHDDIAALKAGLRSAWIKLADPGLTSFDRRELRNFMKLAENALRHRLYRALEIEAQRLNELKARVRKTIRFEASDFIVSGRS